MNPIKIAGFYKNIAVPEKEIIRVEALSNYNRVFPFLKMKLLPVVYNGNLKFPNPQ